MTNESKTPEEKKPDAAVEKEASKELDEQALEKVSGGVRGGDDDLDDLEVERVRRR